MPSDPPFIDPTDRTLDIGQILYEAIPIAALVALFAGLALVPFALVFVFAGNSALGLLLGALGQFILAVGAGVVLLYLLVRADQLA
jgi:hypothetical protein